MLSLLSEYWVLRTISCYHIGLAFYFSSFSWTISCYHIGLAFYFSSFSWNIRIKSQIGGVISKQIYTIWSKNYSLNFVDAKVKLDLQSTGSSPYLTYKDYVPIMLCYNDPINSFDFGHLIETFDWSFSSHNCTQSSLLHTFITKENSTLKFPGLYLSTLL